MTIEISFPGGKRVNARIGNHLIQTDQPPEFGGVDSAPAPFDLFLASLGTCAGIYVLGFLQARGLPTEDLILRQEVDYDPETHLAVRIRIEIDPPAGFPEKYRASIIRVAETCKVKKTIAGLPAFEVTVAGAEEPSVTAGAAS